MGLNGLSEIFSYKLVCSFASLKDAQIVPMKKQKPFYGKGIHVDENELKNAMQIAGWTLPSEILLYLSEYEKKFIEMEFTGKRTLNYYHNRLEGLGFFSLENVIDAGCGMGQWAIALSDLNRCIYGVDINTARLFIATEISQTMQKNNIQYQFSSLEKLPFKDSSMDGIFCYGVFMFTQMDMAVKEFYRVLKPGGRVYLNANAIGWYIHLFMDICIKEKKISMMMTILRILLRTALRKKQNIIISERWLKKLLKNNGFNIIDSGAEGSIQSSNIMKSSIPSAYESTYYGFPGVIEFLAEKVS